MGNLDTNWTEKTFKISAGDFRIQDWLLDSSLSAGAKLTFTILATCARGKDHVWPGIDYLAKKTSASPRSVTRYLDELIKFGLIKKERLHFKGHVRNVYWFIQHETVKYYPGQVDKLTDCPDDQPTIARPKPTNCQDQTANLTDCNNKESENTKGKEEYIPPLPPQPVTGLSVAPTDEGGDINNSPLTEEKPIEHFSESYDGYDPDLKEAKQKILEAAKNHLDDTWLHAIVRSIFERDQDGLVLIRLANKFTLTFLKSKFGDFFTQVNELMLSLGFKNWKWDEYTQEQTEQQDKAARVIDELRKAEESRRAREAKCAAENAHKQKMEEMDNLPPREKFNILFDFYGLDKDREGALKAFLKLHRDGNLPSMQVMMNSIEDHAQNDYWWKTRSRPLLANWLRKSQWKDKPYACR